MFERFLAWWRQPPLRERVLRALLEFEREGQVMVPGREITKRLGLEWTSPYLALNWLEGEGLVQRRAAPDLTVIIGPGERRIHRFKYGLTEAGRARAAR